MSSPWGWSIGHLLAQPRSFADVAGSAGGPPQWPQPPGLGPAVKARKEAGEAEPESGGAAAVETGESVASGLQAAVATARPAPGGQGTPNPRAEQD